SANLQNMSVLSVVGAGHLVGPDSILNLFQKNGYAVTAGSQPHQN
ncbi:MAG: TraB/GumN family protein, partial [Victivallales bacterium]|nr:TraB/GumN family protein [Victivallales bacterium]